MYSLKNTFYEFGDDQKLDLGEPNSVLIRNVGDVKVTINSALELEKGESFASNQLQPDVVDDTQYVIHFDANGVGTKLISVVASYVTGTPEVPYAPSIPSIPNNRNVGTQPKQGGSHGTSC